MIQLHRLTRAREAFHLNPDLILTVEARPDTVIALTTGGKVVVTEDPAQVADAVRRYRADVLAAALRPPVRAV